MKESISSRVGRIISGGIHQLISAFENTAPEAVMENAVQEIDSAIEDVRTELGKNMANRHMASKRLSDANTEYADLTQKIDLAIAKKREDLAEAAIARQLDIEAQIPILESAIRDFTETAKELEGFIAALQAKKREMKDELRKFRQAQTISPDDTPKITGKENSELAIQSRVSHAESAFDRVMEKQTNIATSSPDLKTASQLAELEELSRKNRIQERLTAAKARMEIAEKS